jgi:hypothetical protein
MNWRPLMEVKEPQNIKELRLEIMVQIRDLAKLLGMMPNDDKIVEDARYSFHKLSILIGKALDIPLQ